MTSDNQTRFREMAEKIYLEHLPVEGMGIVNMSRMVSDIQRALSTIAGEYEGALKDANDTASGWKRSFDVAAKKLRETEAALDLSERKRGELVELLKKAPLSCNYYKEPYSCVGESSGEGVWCLNCRLRTLLAAQQGKSEER